jgi:hypothetical protein
MKVYGRVDISIHIFLTSAIVGGEWSDSRPGRFPPGKETPLHIRWAAGWDPDVENTKFLTVPGFELDRSVIQPVASRYTDCAILTI